MRRLALALALLLPLAAQAAEKAQAGLLLISIDGFPGLRFDELAGPQLRAYAASGIRAQRLHPVFPTLTFPNHYSLATGLYPDRHGILGNSMLDPVLGRFSLGNSAAVRDARWWQGEPIWVSAEKQGLIAAACFFPGTEAAIQGVRPHYWLPYDGGMDDSARVDQILRWLDLPQGQRPRFMTLYFSDVDSAGHRHGPDSPEFREAALAVDEALERLQRGLNQRGMDKLLNLIIVSDHGMAQVKEGQRIRLDKLIDPGTIQVVSLGTVLTIKTRGVQDTERIYQKLRNAHPHLQIYREQDLPARWHLHHPRFPGLLGLADEGWTTALDEGRESEGGAHGYDEELESMQALFVASGPAFKQGILPRLDTVDVYGIACAALGIAAAPNQGDPAAPGRVLKGAP